MTKRWQRKRFSRGVAMVEGGILAPVFAMMMLMAIYIGGVYQTKYKTFVDARWKAWDYASNACQTDNSGGGTTTGKDQETNGQTASGSGSGPAANAPGRSDAESGSFIAHTKSTMSWDFSPTYKFNGGKAKSITTESWTMCNEPPGKDFGSEIMSIFSAASGS